MNKLIQKLAEQAGIETEQDQAGNTFLKGWPEDLEKFTELLIRETMQVVANNLPSNLYFDVANAVIEHYGDEE